MKFYPLAAMIAYASIGASLTAEQTLVSFKKLHLDPHYWSEGATFGDLNRDGQQDGISGPYWWEGPGFEKRHEIYPPTQTFTLTEEDGAEKSLPGFEGALGRKNAYSSDNFFAFVYDFDDDGWNDLLTYGLPGTPALMYLNPGQRQEHWSMHTVFGAVDNESPTFTDLTGDGRPEIVCNWGGNFGYARADWNDPTATWQFHPISENGKWGKFTHGLGLGDINGNGRLDLICKDGWFEQPASLDGDPVWKFHPQFFAAAGAQMFAEDINGDGLADVVTSLAAHGYGLAWHEQLPDKNANGSPKWRTHTIMNKEPSENRYGVSFSQLHAVEFVDVDGDGLKDIVTGKCFWAHGPTGDPEPNAPSVLYWFQLARNGREVEWVPHLIDDDSGVGRQIGTGDATGNGRPDFIIGNKKGTFVFLNEARQVNRTEWREAQPKAKHPAAGKQALSEGEVIQRTGSPR